MVQFAPDGVPTIDGCRPAVLRTMVDGELRPLREIVALVGEHLFLTDEQLAQRVSSGQGRLENRVGWACSSMFQAGLLARERRGWYRITSDGRAVDSRNLTEYSEAELQEWPAWNEYVAELSERKARASEDSQEPHVNADPAGESDSFDHEATIQAIVTSANSQIETELRKLLQEASPEFFERAVLEVLWSMGYGGGQGQKEHLGKTADGGIDGVIRQDPLGLRKVYVQAKRYADNNTVGSPDINGFYGALARKGADRGVFITSSRFSPAAKEAADQFGGRIILIDGLQLTSLMLQYGVGVESAAVFTLYSVDQDFFALD